MSFYNNWLLLKSLRADLTQIYLQIHHMSVVYSHLGMISGGLAYFKSGWHLQHSYKHTSLEYGNYWWHAAPLIQHQLSLKNHILLRHQVTVMFQTCLLQMGIIHLVRVIFPSISKSLWCFCSCQWFNWHCNWVILTFPNQNIFTSSGFSWELLTFHWEMNWKEVDFWKDYFSCISNLVVVPKSMYSFALSFSICHFVAYQYFLLITLKAVRLWRFQKWGNNWEHSSH